MYNMNISIFGYKVNVELLILIGVIYLIIIVSTAYGCCKKYKYMEGIDGDDKKNKEDESKEHDDKKNKDYTIDPTCNKPSVDTVTQLATQVPAGNNPTVPAAASDKKEAFTGAKLNGGQSSPYDLENDTYMDVSKWSTPDLSVTSCKQNSAGVKEILNRPKQQLPLPEGEMFFFETTQFKPECCPNTYSNSSGCACMTTEQYNYLVTRSGNNLPYSEY